MHRVKLVLFFVSFFRVSVGIKCNSCIGFDVAGNQELETALGGFLSELPNSLPQSNNPKCLTDPASTDTVTCNSICVSAVSSLNTESLGVVFGENEEPLDLGNGKSFSFTKESFQQLKDIKVAIHSCLDNIVQAFDVDLQDMGLQDVSSQFPSNPACVGAKVGALGVNVTAKVCGCATDDCNAITPSDVGKTETVPAVNDADFTRECPTPARSWIPLSYCNVTCENDSDCAGDRMCCNTATCVDEQSNAESPQNQCRMASYTRSFSTKNCSEVVLGSTSLQNTFDGLKSEILKKTKHSVPPFGDCQDSNKAASSDGCKTAAIFADAYVSVEAYNGPDLPIPQDIMDAFQISKINEFGDASITVRGCLDKMFKEMLMENVPKIPETNACGEVSANVYGIIAVGKGCACNTAECNGEGGGEAKQVGTQLVKAEKARQEAEKNAAEFKKLSFLPIAVFLTLGQFLQKL